jgi:hypothetical protein
VFVAIQSGTPQSGKRKTQNSVEPAVNVSSQEKGALSAVLDCFLFRAQQIRARPESFRGSFPDEQPELSRSEPSSLPLNLASDLGLEP